MENKLSKYIENIWEFDSYNYEDILISRLNILSTRIEYKIEKILNKERKEVHGEELNIRRAEIH